MIDERRRLFDLGRERIDAWLDANPDVPQVVVREHNVRNWPWIGACARYHCDMIDICVELCTLPGQSGHSWSWPGYPLDETPYGVLAHELFHHVDVHISDEERCCSRSFSGSFSTDIREATGDDAITSYCPNDREWFAEMGKLFVTNPDLLWLTRPRTHNVLAQRFRPIEPVLTWDQELARFDAPARILNTARRQIERHHQNDGWLADLRSWFRFNRSRTTTNSGARR